MRYRLLFLAIQLCCIGYAYAADSVSKISLRYDGVYVSEPFEGDGGNENYCHYLRFYPRGTVITVSSVCDRAALKDIKKWFGVNNAGSTHTGISRGKIKIEENKISFFAISLEGNVTYEGEMVNDRLVLSSHSHINGHNDNGTYSFAKW
jgi:hypothetical protein